MQTADIRQRWLDFFAARGHTVVPSASLISDDPTLMFTVAGMVPFVPYLTGVVPAPFPRATSVQKCIRTNDIEEVGRTPRHGTFFQMNGNFSFGDYFKQEAIGYAWELLTTSEAEGGYGFDPKDLWVTVYKDDDEAIRLWRSISGLPEERIQRLDKDTNYWSTGQPGPAGPCSEIFFDRGPAYGVDGGPATDDDRYVEIWNLVFMQYLVDEVRSKTDFHIVGELPQKNIDTGMGLERVAFLKQGVENMYETDQVRPVLDRAAELAGRRYGADHDDDVRLRIVADHVRSGLMLISDGVTPSNEGRGYILRRLLRRVVRSMRLMGVDTVTFPELFTVSRDAMAPSYPEVASDFERISRAAYAEEETFLRTLAAGTSILDVAVAQTKKEARAELPGDTAFLLHDTYGFPIELTLEIAEESGLQVDRGAFDRLMAEQRARAKADARSRKSHLADLTVYRDLRAEGETVFTGYESLETPSRVLGVIVDGASVQSASAGQLAEIILAETPLYAESGGQEADSGRIVGAGFEADVVDVQRPIAGLISHRVQITDGTVAVGDAATGIVDPVYRVGAARAHSATHLVHAALRQTLGQSAHQAGSLNRAGYMRLDFSWSQPLSEATRSEIEEVANRAIGENYEVITRVLPLQEAKDLGAMALFGEKYGDEVRMVEIGGPWSRELCAGTHVTRSAEIGLIDIVGESSVGASARRVEALVGWDAFRELAAERALVAELSRNLKAPKEQLADRVSELSAQLRAAQRRIAEFEAKALAERVPALLSGRETVGGVEAVIAAVEGVSSGDELRSLATDVRERLGSAAAVVALGASVEGRGVVVVAANRSAVAGGVKAGQLVRAASEALGGGGGGKDDFAQGGGPRGDALAQALTAIRGALG